MSTAFLPPDRVIKNVHGVVDVGCGVLRRRAVEVEQGELERPWFAGLVAELVRCVAQGVGVAAPQVGFGVRVIVVEDGPDKWPQGKLALTDAQLAERGRVVLPRMVLVNPVLTPIGDDTADYLEACMSIGQLAAAVPRHLAVHLRALDPSGSVVEGEYQGWPARILQHEIDHLDGVLFMDRMDPRTLVSYATLAEVWAGASIAELRAGLNAGQPRITAPPLRTAPAPAPSPAPPPPPSPGGSSPRRAP